MLVNFKLRGDETQAEESVGPILDATKRVQAANPDVYVGEFGSASANKALSKAFEDDFKKAETLSLPITLLILVFAFGALVAAGVPLLLGLSAVMAALGLVALPSQIVPLGENTASIILLVGLAVGVDYTLFYLRREREERAAGRGHRDAIHIAAATSGRAVLISGLTVIVAMAGMFLAGDMTFTALGVGAITVVLVAMIGSVTVVPAILSVLGDKVEKGAHPVPRPRARAARAGCGTSCSTACSGARWSRRSPRPRSCSCSPSRRSACARCSPAPTTCRATSRSCRSMTGSTTPFPGGQIPAVVTIARQGRHDARDPGRDPGPGVPRGRDRPLQRPGRRDGVQGQAGGPDRDPDQGRRRRRRLERRRSPTCASRWWRRPSAAWTASSRPT